MTTTVAGDSRLARTEYRFSLERLEELNRSPVPLLLARLNNACPSYGKTPADISNPADLVDEISAHCGGDDNFIKPSMPLQEILFRTLLLQAGEPMTLADLHQELTDRWSSPVRPITVTVGGLARILDNDEFYGFAAVPVAESEPEEPLLPMLGAVPEDDSGPTGEPVSAVVRNLDDDDDADLFDDDEDGDDDDDPFDEDDDFEED